MTKKLSETERHQDLAPLLAKGWTAVEGRDAIATEFKFANFLAAFGWMSQAAIIAEKMNHHPEWFNQGTDSESICGWRLANRLRERRR